MFAIDTPNGMYQAEKLSDFFATDCNSDIAEIDRMLDNGKLYVVMASGRYWKVRRNGATRRWKRNPKRFRIPVKVGFKIYHEITDDNLRHFAVAFDT